MQQTSSLASLIADAREREAAAARMPSVAYFGKRCIAAFPSLYRHPAVRSTRHVLPALQQWSFILAGVEFLVQWHEGKGGYWTFHAWDGSHTLMERDSFAYYTTSTDVALRCFVGAALTAAQTAQKATVAP